MYQMESNFLWEKIWCYIFFCIDLYRLKFMAKIVLRVLLSKKYNLNIKSVAKVKGVQELTQTLKFRLGTRNQIQRENGELI